MVDVLRIPCRLQVAQRNARLGLRLASVAQLGAGVVASKGRFSSLLRKAGSAVKIGGGTLVASIRQLGNNQQDELHVAGWVLQLWGVCAAAVCGFQSFPLARGCKVPGNCLMLWPC